MSLQQYATLTPDLSTVVSISTVDSVFVAALVSAGNPKANFLRPVNMTAQPTFNPATQAVTQNGWTITATDVEPVWVVQSLTAAQQQLIAFQNTYHNLITNGIVTAFNNSAANWSAETSATKDTMLLNLIQLAAALLESEYGVTS